MQPKCVNYGSPLPSRPEKENGDFILRYRASLGSNTTRFIVRDKQGWCLSPARSFDVSAHVSPQPLGFCWPDIFQLLFFLLLTSAWLPPHGFLKSAPIVTTISWDLVCAFEALTCTRP